MDYKKIIRSRSVRRTVLNLLRFVPDKIMVKMQYKIKTGRRLNLKMPQRLSEKMQWYKLYYRDERMILCVDKYDVRKYVSECGLEEILIPCAGVYSAFNEIDFDSIPWQEIVIKDTLGGGGDSVILIDDIKKMNLSEIEKSVNAWLKTKHNARCGGREWPYYSGKHHRVIIEKKIKPVSVGLIDYKFFCFNGVFKFMYVLTDRVVGQKVKLGIFDCNLRKLEVYRADEEQLLEFDEWPQNIAEMINVAEILSKGFPEVRVDLYNVDGKIYFGELTFFDGSGYLNFEPDSFDYRFGDYFELPVSHRKGYRE